MKRLSVFLAVVLFSLSLFANTFTIPSSPDGKDVLTLVNKADGTPTMSFEGVVKKIKKCEVIFETEWGTYFIPSYDIYSVSFADSTNRLLQRYFKIPADDRCMKGTMDAQMFHKTGGAFAAGVLFGGFAVIGAAIIQPTPNSSARMSENGNLFSDPVYLNCYSQTAKKKNVQSAALGWGTWILIFLAILGASY
jgi:hypothetical protein